MFRRSHSQVRLRRPHRGGMFHQLHAKMHRLPAHLTSEDDWRQDQPGVRLSRVFGVVLGIHIIAIGGLMAYEMFRHREPAPAPGAPASRPAAREARPSMAAAAAARATDAFADDPVHDGMVKHVVGPGERLAGIAAQYKVDEKALMVKNHLGDGRAFQSGMKLVIPNQQLKAAAPAAPDRLLAGAPPAGPGRDAAAEAAQSGGDGLVPVAAGPYDPSLPTKRAEPVADAAATPPAAQKPAAPQTTASTRPVPAAKSATKPPAKPTGKSASPVVAAKKPASAAAAKKPETAATKPKTKGRVHVVKDGENAYRIAKSYGVNVDRLVQTNGINPNALRPGTTLTIPASR